MPKKMNATQRDAVLQAHRNRTGGENYIGMTMARSRTLAVLRREAWVAGPFDIPTTAGLIAAEVDMDAIHADARVEDYLRRPHMVRAMEIGAAERERAALRAAADQSPAHVRNHCPADAIGGCLQCTAPASVRASRGDDSAYTTER